MSNPGAATLDQFAGTFQISDHSKLSEILVEYLFERFYSKIDNKWISRSHILSDISLEEINTELNEVWEWPGSVAKLKRYIQSSRADRLGEIVGEKSVLGNYKVPTVDDHLTKEE